MPFLKMEIAEGSSPLLTTFLFNCYPPTQQVPSRAMTAGARSFVNERRVKMQLTFCLHRNVIFQCIGIVIISYASSVYSNASTFYVITISTDIWKSYWFCIPAEDEKMLTIFFFGTDNSIQERLLGNTACSWLSLLPTLSTSWKHNAL